MLAFRLGGSVQNRLLATLYAVTFLVIVVMVLLINWTTQVICDNDGAREFLERLQGIPLEGWRVALLSLACFAAIAALTLVRGRWRGQLVPQLAFSAAELALGVALILVLGF